MVIIQSIAFDLIYQPQRVYIRSIECYCRVCLRFQRFYIAVASEYPIGVFAKFYCNQSIISYELIFTLYNI